MRKIFIDCGAHKATSVKNFKENYPNAEEYEIYSFEANKGFEHHFINEHPDVELMIAIVWIRDGEEAFYNCKNESSSVFKRMSESIGPKELVKSIDFDRWIKENATKDDHIVLKMDIEGAEYEVLEHMIENGSIEYIDKLFIEWHCAKIVEIKVERHIKLLEDLAEIELAPYTWSFNNPEFNKLALDKRDIARGKKGQKKRKNFEKHKDRYIEACNKFKELDSAALSGSKD